MQGLFIFGRVHLKFPLSFPKEQKRGIFDYFVAITAGSKKGLQDDRNGIKF
jgi:hypothetical protein